MPTLDSDLILDLEQLRSVTLDDPKLMREILCTLVEDTGRQTALIEAAQAERDTSRAIRLTRAAARACDHVGAYRTAGALRSIERAAASRDVAAAAAALSSLRAETERLRAEAARM